MGIRPTPRQEVSYSTLCRDGSTEDVIVEVSYEFTGTDLDLRWLFVRTKTGSVQTRDLLALNLPTIKSIVAKKAIVDAPLHYRGEDLREMKNTDHGQAVIAQLYWYHHVVSGTPRQVLMEMLDMPRSTVNVLLRKVNKAYPLPR
jgi:hypothetical protein